MRLVHGGEQAVQLLNYHRKAAIRALGQAVVSSMRGFRGSLWEEGKAGWLEVDTVALCGGSVAEFVWMVDGVDYATTWVEVRAM